MNICIAFESETMEQHVSEGLKIIDLFIRRHYAHRVIRFMDEEGINTISKAEAILKLIYIMHDIGKGLRTFQQGTRFGGHEFISAYIFDNMKILIDGQLLSEIARRIIALAILLHHHTLMKNMVKKRLSIIKDEICPACLNIIKQFLPSNIELIYIPKKIVGNDVIRHVEKYLVHDTLGKGKYYRKAYMLLIPLMVADNYAANKNRGGKGTILGEEINKIILFWQKTLGV